MEAIFMMIQSTVLSPLSILTWRDCIEIYLFSSFFYYCALWLKKDSKKNLLPYFYGYIGLTLCSYVAELHTISTFLFMLSPIAMMLFILMHQQLLQRNMVSLKNITPALDPTSPDWLSDLMKTSLEMLSNEKDMIMLIEHTDSLEPFVQTPHRLDTPLSYSLLSLLVHELYSPAHLCWVSSTGSLRGINAQFKASWHPSAYKTQTAWIDDAIAYTEKTDAVIVFANAKKHTYSVAHRGAIKQNLAMEQAHQLIKKCIDYHLPLPNKGLNHGVAPTKKFIQRSP